jgi:hypothetical protein
MWLKAALDQRLAGLEERMPPGVAAILGFDIVTLTLTEPAEDATPEEIKKWDETCDHCGKYVPGELYSGRGTWERAGTPVIIFFGCCADCKVLP